MRLSLTLSRLTDAPIIRFLLMNKGFILVDEGEKEMKFVIEKYFDNDNSRLKFYVAGTVNGFTSLASKMFTAVE